MDSSEAQIIKRAVREGVIEAMEEVFKRLDISEPDSINRHYRTHLRPDERHEGEMEI